MSSVITFLLNGVEQRVDSAAPTMTLLNWLRYEKRLTGTKEGCAEGDCGACTVALRELGPRGRLTQRTVNACIHLLPMVHGKEVVTVEHLTRDGDLHPVQKAMSEGHGSQCGFCTPGFVMSLWHGYETGAPTDAGSVADQLAGNLCRCTGYGPILNAAQVARDLPDAPSDKPDACTRLKALDAGPLTYEVDGCAFWAPQDADTLAQLVETHPDATILAGATDVGLWVTKQGFAPDKIIYLGDCADLAEIEETLTGVQIPAAVSHQKAMSSLAEMFPDMGELWRRFASEQVRSAGTLCGNIANGSPIGDAPPALIAVGATLAIRKGAQIRHANLEDFFIEYSKQDLSPGEFVQAVDITAPDDPMDLRCYKISKRFDQDISAIMAAINIRLRSEKIVEVRIAFGGMAATPKRAKAAEAALKGKPFAEAAFKAAMDALDQDFAPIDDHRASAAYRMKTAKNLILKYFVERNFGEVRITGRGKVLAQDVVAG